MLKISEIKNIIPAATQKFKEIFPDAFIAPIVVCSSSRRQAVRDRVLAECGAAYKEDMYGTDAEVIFGSLGTQVILYQSMLKTEEQVYHAIWHELGHIRFGTEEKYGIDLEVDSPKRSGYAVVNEFMAEYVAYIVNDFELFRCSHKAHIYLQMAFMERGVNVYWFSRYLAIVIGDKNISESEIDSGAQYVLPEIWNIISQTIDELSGQISKPEFWDVSDDFLEKIGYLFDEMFHIHYVQGVIKC